MEEPLFIQTPRSEHPGDSGSDARTLYEEFGKEYMKDVERSGCRISRQDKRCDFSGRWVFVVVRLWSGQCCIEAY